MKRTARIIAMGLVAALGLAVLIPAQAVTRTVLNLGDAGADTLRGCLASAAPSGDIIDFNTNGTIILASSLNITSDVTIVGPGPTIITISGNVANRIFTVTNRTATISGLTFSNGLASGSDGGALYQAGGNITLSNCVFLNNQAIGSDGAAGGFGGAIFVTGGVITVRASTFSNNTAVGPHGLQVTANWGGGGGGSAGLGGALSLLNGTGYFYQCVFNANSVTGGAGGTGGWTLPFPCNGGHGGGVAGGAGGTAGSINGVAGGEFSGGGGGRSDWGIYATGGNGGFAGGGGGGGSAGSDSGGTKGVGGQFGGNGGDTAMSASGGGGGGGGLGGAIFTKDSAIICSNVSLTGNSAVKGKGGDWWSADGTGAGGSIFCHGGSINMYLTTFSGNTGDVYRDVYGVPTILGTNGTTIGNAEAASAAKGTDFGAIPLGQAITNVLAITNSCTNDVTISGVTTNGTGAASFQIVQIPASVSAGASSNFNVIFHPAAAGSYTCVVSISNDSATTPYIVYLAGGTVKQDQAITNFTPTNGSAFATTSTVGLFAQASSGLAVTNFAVLSGPGVLDATLTNLTFTNSGSVSVKANQAGDDSWNAASTLTNTFNVLPAQASWLAIQVTPVSGTWQLTAPAGYTGPTSGTGNLAAVSAVTGQYGITYGALAGYVAPSNQSQFVTGASTTLFTGVYLQVSTNIATPTGVAATEGTYTNMIRITWQGVAGATGYEIWRSRTNTSDSAGRIADIPESSALRLQPIPSPVAGKGPLAPGATWQSTAYYYNDYAISPILSYYYWVRAKTGTLISPMSYVGMGYAALSPEEKSGTADIAMSDLVYLPVNVTNNSIAGTVSCRLANLGPDALNTAGVACDFYMSTNADTMVWIGSAQSNMTLSTGEEELIILTPSAKRVLTVRADLRDVQQVKVVVRHLSTLNDPNLANNTTTAAGSVRIKTSGVNSPGRSLNDYDGDGKADVAIWHAGNNLWALCLSGQRYGAISELDAGSTGDMPVPGDYDGDGLTDIAIYCHLNGWWNVLLSSNEQIEKEYFIGGQAFTAAQCDFDGDSKTDPMVYREADGYWLGQASSRQYAQCDTSLGETGYQSVVADYDGDGLADPAVYNRITGLWAISLSGRGYQPLVTGTFGGSGYLPVSADYDGDGLADPAVYAPGTAHWQVLFSGSLATHGCYTWGDAVLVTIGGIPVPADYDGDGKADLAVYHQDTPSAGSGQAGLWELYLSTQDYQLVWGLFGGPEYQPVTE